MSDNRNFKGNRSEKTDGKGGYSGNKSSNNSNKSGYRGAKGGGSSYGGSKSNYGSNRGGYKSGKGANNNDKDRSIGSRNSVSGGRVGYHGGTDRTRKSYTVQTERTPRAAKLDENVSADSAANQNENTVCGRNSVMELLKSGRPIDKLLVAKREEGVAVGSAAKIVALAEQLHIPVIETERGKLTSLVGGINHQGVVAIIPEREYSTIDDMLALADERGEKPLIIIADEIEDPNNLGAIIRTAESAGAHGIIIPKRRSATLTASVSRASAGALEHFMVARVPNLSQAAETLREAGLWLFAADVGGTDYDKCDLTLPCALILGGEDTGVSKKLGEKCDFTVSIPMRGKLNSLNVSAAAAVILYEAVRQRLRAGL